MGYLRYCCLQVLEGFLFELHFFGQLLAGCRAGLREHGDLLTGLPSARGLILKSLGKLVSVHDQYFIAIGQLASLSLFYFKLFLELLDFAVHLFDPGIHLGQLLEVLPVGLLELAGDLVVPGQGLLVFQLELLSD